VGLERGPLSLVSTIEELLEIKSSGSGLERREYGCRDPTGGCRSVGIFRSQTKATEFILGFLVWSVTLHGVWIGNRIIGLSNTQLVTAICKSHHTQTRGLRHGPHQSYGSSFQRPVLFLSTGFPNCPFA
jgi:hypothetical protein